jgi:drug/metabolite transporter (DMT)-like permease
LESSDSEPVPTLDKRRLLSLLEATFAVTAWGASFIATKVALRDVSPVTVVWLRFAMGVPILGAVVVLRRQMALPTRKDLGYFALLGFLGVTFHQWLQSTGLVTSQASTTAWIVATTPVFIALLGWLLLKERMGALRIAGILLAALGVFTVVSRGDLRSLVQAGFGEPGDILILVSSLNWAVFSVLSRYELKRHPAARMMLFVMGFGWVFTSVLFFAGPAFSELKQLTFDGWLGVAFLGIACSGLAYIAWYDALQALPASQVGAFLYLEPLVAVIVAAIILGEAILLASLIGGGVILWGVWLVNKPARKKSALIPDAGER